MASLKPNPKARYLPVTTEQARDTLETQEQGEVKMTTYGPIIEELEHELTNMAELWLGLGTRQVRVTRHPPGGASADITIDYADGLRAASDALNKAVAALKNVKD
jgi:hypothetical protein